MINLSDLVRKEGSIGMLDSFRFAYDSDVYLFEDVGDFLANKDRIYVHPLKQFPFQFADPFSTSFYAIIHDVYLERIKVKDKIVEGYWEVHDKTGQFVSLWHEGEGGDYMKSPYTFEKANSEQGFNSGDLVHSLSLKHFQKISLPVVIDLQKDGNWKCPETDSILDKIRDKFDKIILSEPELN